MRNTAIAAVLLCLCLGTAYADFTAWSLADPYPYSSALDWTGASIDFPQWNPASYPGYSLVGAEIWLRGDLFGNNDWDLLSGSNQTITMFQRATIELQLPGGGASIVTVIPEQIDTWNNQTAEVSGTQILSAWKQAYGSVSGVDLLPFIGAGDVTTPLASTDFHYGNSAGSGGSVFQTEFAPSASARAMIRYEYQRGEIPEPGTLALVGFGLVGLVGVVRRRRNK